MRLPETEIHDDDIRIFLDAIRDNSNYDFSNYSVKSLKRRLSKVLSDNNMNMNELTKAIAGNWTFMESVVKKITVSTTELFRDPKIWRAIRDEVLPTFRDRKKIRIWHPGCSTGQEVYSMMILLAETGLFEKTDIYASDINTDLIEMARQGKYKYRFNEVYITNFDAVFNSVDETAKEPGKIPHERYFTINKTSDLICMKPFLTDKPFYDKIDLARDNNKFDLQFDLIICRNVIIYFNDKLQNKVFNLFFHNLTDHGCLVLGLHESILGSNLIRFEKMNTFYYKIPEMMHP